VNGKAPTTAEAAHKMVAKALPTLKLTVGRIAYKEIIPCERASKVQLKRQSGYSYFVSKIQRVGSVHLGLGIKTFHGKTTVNRTDEDSLAAYIYLVGDVILDINGEKVNDVNMLREKMIHSMKSVGYFTTVIERQEPTQATHNVQICSGRAIGREVDPPMANDVFMITQREFLKHQLCSKRRHKIKGIVAKSDMAVTVTQADETITQDEPRRRKKVSTSSMSNSKERTRTSHSKRENLSGRFDFLDLSSSRKKRQKKKHISFNAKKDEEEKISTDVVNPIFLQHVRNLNKQGFAKTLTMMPNFFKRS